MTTNEEKPKKRTKAFLQCDIFEDQFSTMQEITAQTGKPRAQLVREALDQVYPRKEK